MSISNGQLANQTNFNTAFVSRTANQTVAGDKEFQDDVKIDGTTTIATSNTGPVKAAAGVLSSSDIDLTSEVTGVLPVANGGTNASSLPAGAAYSTGTALATEAQLTVPRGGTGVATFTSNGVVYGNAAGNLLVTAAGTTGTVLKGVTGSPPAYGAVDLTTDVTATLPVSNGGTGNSSLTAKTVLVGNGTSAITQIGPGTTGQVLKGVTGLDPAFGSVSLTTDISGTLPIANGGTGQTTQTNAFDALAPSTTKGDLIVHDGTDNVRRAVGTNGQVLTADSTTADGVKWATPTVGSTSPLTTKGDIWGYSTLDARVPVGTNGQVLTADSTQALGVKWATPSSGASVSNLYNVIFGSAAQVTAGTATNSTFASWTQADGDSVMVLPGYTESASWTITKKVSITGQGNFSQITGSLTFATGSNYSCADKIRVSTGITVNSGVVGLWVDKVWFPASVTFTDNSTALANYLAAMVES